jgi:Restriction endonuclease fold toxin 7
MATREDVTQRLQELEQPPEAGYYAVDLDDADCLLTIEQTLAPFRSMTSGVPGPDTPTVVALAVWLEGYVSSDEDAATADAIVARFAPFLRAPDLTAYLDASAAPVATLASLDLRDAVSYQQAIAATWGPTAAGLAARLGSTGPSAGHLERDTLAACGVCAAPIALLCFSLDGGEAYHLASSLALAAATLQSRLAQWPGDGPQDRMMLRDSLARLLQRKQAQLRGVVADLPAALVPGQQGPDALAAAEHAGALIALRGECDDLGQDLSDISIPKHKLVSRLSKAGITDPILIDQNPQLDRLKALQPVVDRWITEALEVAGHDPRNPGLTHFVDRIAMTLGALRTRLSMIQITERLIDDGETGLYDQLKDPAVTIDTALVFLELDKDYDHVRDVIIKVSSEAYTLVTSYRWATIIRRAMQDAANVMLSIETGSRMGGVGPSLQTAMVSGATARGIITAAELDRLLFGATIVMMASKADPQKGRRKGIKAEKGLKLSPNRPRDDISSITDTAKARYPDNIKFTTFWEVKNVAKLRLTRQLTDFILYAQASGQKMVLYVRPNIAGKVGTTLAPSLTKALSYLRSEGLLQIRYLKIY